MCEPEFSECPEKLVAGCLMEKLADELQASLYSTRVTSHH